MHCFLNPLDLLNHFLGDAFKDLSKSTCSARSQSGRELKQGVWGQPQLH